MQNPQCGESADIAAFVIAVEVKYRRIKSYHSFVLSDTEHVCIICTPVKVRIRQFYIAFLKRVLYIPAAIAGSFAIRSNGSKYTPVRVLSNHYHNCFEFRLMTPLSVQ
jgi:hypothetical protein